MRKWQRFFLLTSLVVGFMGVTVVGWCSTSLRGPRNFQLGSNRVSSLYLHPFRRGAWDDQQQRSSKSQPSFPQPSSEKHRPENSMAVLARGVGTLLLLGAILFSPLQSATASDRTELPLGKRYAITMESGEPQEILAANKALLEYAVRTVNTHYYDNTGGAFFQPRDFYNSWRQWLKEQPETALSSRSGVVGGLQWIASQLNDPFSRYLTREELRAELEQSSHGFLGLGAMVESPDQRNQFFGSSTAPVIANLPPDVVGSKGRRSVMSAVQVAKFPVVTAVAPDSPAEWAGLVVGDRIISVGNDSFLPYPASAAPRWIKKYSSAQNYVGYSKLIVAKPVYASSTAIDVVHPDVIVAYRPTHVRLPTMLTADMAWQGTSEGSEVRLRGGDSVVHYELLKSQGTIFKQLTGEWQSNDRSVGYIRLTRFSRASTAGFLNAIQQLEQNGATSFIIDLRNNYGGVIQEAMLTAATLLRDAHTVLCYTLNANGGFTPHPVEEYVIDTRYPGYLLSSEPVSTTLNQLKRENREMFGSDGSIIDWAPPSSFASLHEQGVKRGIHRSSNAVASSKTWDGSFSPQARSVKGHLAAQKNIVLLINEGTASSAELFASALHDNGRTVALVGTKTFGKGLIQHTFRLPDGGGLRLTIAEYLTPALRHVTHVGGARFDRETGWVGGGISPDISCESRQGIPRNVGADLCVGLALDALEEADLARSLSGPELAVKRLGGLDDGSRMRRPVTVGIVKDDF